MKIAYLLSTFLVALGISFVSIKQKATSSEPTVDAKAYCDCLRKNGAPQQQFYATAVCDGDFVQKYRLFRINRIEIRIKEAIPKATLDSAVAYKNAFNKYIIQHCCEVILECAIDSGKRKTIIPYRHKYYDDGILH